MVYFGVILMVYTVPDTESTLQILNMQLLKLLDIMVCISLNELLKSIKRIALINHVSIFCMRT